MYYINPLKERVKILLKQFGLYHFFKYSRIYHEILKYKNPSYIRALDSDLAFYKTALGVSLDLIFDVGANHGDKAWAFKQIAQKVVCFEPDKTCFEALSKRYSAKKGMYLEHCALGARLGVGTLFVEEEGSAYNTLNKKERDWILTERNQNIKEVAVPISTLDIMIEKYGCPDFVKIDVEGGEEEVFRGLSNSIPIICFEANLPRFRDETLRILGRFSQNDSTRFNLRLEDDFLFSEPKKAMDIISVLNENEEVSYDIFVFRNK